jgi:hypothetical protein
VRGSRLVDALHAAVLLKTENDAARTVPRDHEHLAQREFSRIIGTAKVAGLKPVFAQ